MKIRLGIGTGLRRIAVLLCLSQALLGCAEHLAQKPAATRPEEVSGSVQSLDAARFERRTAELDARIKTLGMTEEGSDEAVVVRLELAYINLDYRNPARNYQLALRELEEVLQRIPRGSPARFEVENLAAALRAVQSLKERLDRERQEVERLRQGLERLQDVEMEIEKKRKRNK